VIAALAAAALSGPLPKDVLPVPIGTGRAYRIEAAPAPVRRGRDVGALRCTRDGSRYGIHLELFADRRVVPVPAGIGVASPSRRRAADVEPGGCSYPIRTVTPTGVVEVSRGAPLTLGDLFAVWGQPLAAGRLAGFRGTVRAFVGGRVWRGAVTAIPLRRHAQIVVEVGGYVPPHPTFLFGGGL